MSAQAGQVLGLDRIGGATLRWRLTLVDGHRRLLRTIGAPLVIKRRVRRRGPA